MDTFDIEDEVKADEILAEAGHQLRCSEYRRSSKGISRSDNLQAQ